MRKLLLIAIVCFKSIHLFSQRMYRLGALVEYSDNAEIRTGSIGVNFELFPRWSDRLALNYRFLIGGSSNNCLYVRSTFGGAATAAVIKAAGSENYAGYLAALLVIIPEGISFYLLPDNKVNPAIYVNPLGADYFYKSSAYELFKVNGEAGIKMLIKKTEKMSLQSFLGVKYFYNNKGITPIFFNAGFGIMFHDL